MTFLLLRAALAGACALALGACATGYGNAGLLGGYSERQIEPGLWRVQFQTNGFTAPDRAALMAMYRSAEIARDAGFSHFQVIDGNVRVTVLTQYGQPMGSAGERARLRIRGANSADPPSDCAIKAAACRTFSVAETLATLGPALDIRRRDSDGQVGGSAAGPRPDGPARR